MITPDPSFKWLGLLSILIVWSGLIFLLYKWRGNKRMSFSLHAAQTKNGQIYYFVLFATVLPMFYLFIIKWFVHTLGLNNWFTLAVTVGVLGQLLAVLVPAIPGIKGQIHNFGAYIMAFTMLPAVLLIAFANVPYIVTIASLAAATYMIFAASLFIFFKKSHDYYLIFQAIYIATFHANIILSSYIV